MIRSVLLTSLIFVFSSFIAVAQEDSIDVFIAGQMKQQGIVGVSVGVVRNGRVVKAKGYGLANIELNVPASEKTVYKIASVSKQFVAAGIMKLVQEKKLSISDPVTKYIKGAPAKWNSITVRHLLNHTSGLPAEPPGFDGMKEQPDSVYIRSAFTIELASPPGSKFEYSNFGYFVLADIIRIVSHLSFSDYMKNNIFDECGLRNTRATSLEAIVPNRADGYITNDGKSVLNAVNYPAVRPSGAFLSDITDLLKWELYMQSGKLLSQNSWEQMWADVTKTPLTMDDEAIYYGYGWMTNKAEGKRLVHHGGSLPGFKSAYFRYIENRTAIVVLTNSENTDAYGIAFGVADLLRMQGKK